MQLSNERTISGSIKFDHVSGSGSMKLSGSISGSMTFGSGS